MGTVRPKAWNHEGSLCSHCSSAVPPPGPRPSRRSRHIWLGGHRQCLRAQVFHFEITIKSRNSESGCVRGTLKELKTCMLTSLPDGARLGAEMETKKYPKKRGDQPAILPA